MSLLKDSLFATVANSSDSSPLLESADKKVSAFSRYLSSIDWNQIISELIGKAISLLALSLFFFILKKVGTQVIKRTFAKYQTRESFTESRLKTVYTLTNNIFYYTLSFFFLYSLLTILGVPVGSLLAGAGIAGLAIGLGAQGFMSDIITGFFIILERQLDVGDYIIINPIEGHVVSVGLRTTQVKSVDGTVHFVPNHCITIVSNRSRSNMQAVVDIRIKPDADLNKVNELVNEVNRQLVSQYPEIQSGPDILGLTDLGAGNFAFRIIFYTQNGQRGKIQRIFLAAYVEALTADGITIP